MIFFSLAFFLFCESKVFLNEDFSGDWESRWVQSEVKEDSFYGVFQRTAGKWYGDIELDAGIMTSEPYKHYVISRSMDNDEEFDSKDQVLVIQYALKNTQEEFGCGGAYLKFGGFDSLEGDFQYFDSSTEYSIMFGVDICHHYGSLKDKIQFILNYNGENLEWRHDKVQPPKDRLTHIYTAIIYPKNTYEVLVDGVVVARGKLDEDWDFLEDELIYDPTSRIPDDWEEPEFIPDRKAKRPADWNEEENGVWEAPLARNPEFDNKRFEQHRREMEEERRRMMREFEEEEMRRRRREEEDEKADIHRFMKRYRGSWRPRMFPNPNYRYDPEMHRRKIQWVGIEIMQENPGSIFNHIFVGNDLSEAKIVRDEIMKRFDKEKEMYEAFLEDKRIGEDL